ncbi:Reverse transcriptase (RNA-dependent DNA polymerase) [Popillia japonica]|uniref:Annexin n=1 Tax=Popillia japonica TaxID=7064 RepID=A0AAW1MRG4_POPJA
MYEDCGICNAKVKQNDTSVICSGLCGRPYHNRCINLTAKDCQFILSLNNLKWFCENCLLSFNNYFEMNKKVEDLEKTMNVEMNKINKAIRGSHLDQKSTQKTFSEVAGNTVIIKPKNKQDTRATRDDIIKKLNPTELELGITGVRNMREGGLAITCQTDEDTTKIRKEVTRKLKNYSVVTREPKKPCIKIVDIADDLNEEKLRTCIVKQNGSILHHETDFRIKTIKKMKKTYMAIVECDPITFKKLTNVGRLTLGWSVCRIYEHAVVGYADDIAVLISVRDIDAAQLKLNQAMRKIESWMQRHGLSLALHKTEIVILTKRRIETRRIETTIPVKVEAAEVMKKPTIKYLGINSIKNEKQQTVYQSSLESDLKGDTSGTVKRLFVALVTAHRDESENTDKEAAYKDAQTLLRAGELFHGTDESTFNAILCQRSRAQLRVIFSEYENLTGHNFETAIDNEFSGTAKDSLIDLVKCIRNKIDYMAERLYKSMEGMGTDDRTLIRLVVSRSEIDLQEIKQVFEEKYGKSLADFINDDTSGDYKRCLLSVVD